MQFVVQNTSINESKYAISSRNNDSKERKLKMGDIKALEKGKTTEKSESSKEIIGYYFPEFGRKNLPEPIHQHIYP